ncbi:hypothetical protein PMAYCL1PPCAC_20323, partial [Pristionchus mayeri]
ATYNFQPLSWMFPFSHKKEKAATPTSGAPVIAPVIISRPRPPLPPEKPARATRESPPAPDAYEAPVYDNIGAPSAAAAPTLPPRVPRTPVSVVAMVAGMNGGHAPPQLPPRQHQQPPVLQQPATRREQPVEEEEPPRIVFRTNRRSTEDQRAGSGSHAFGSLKEFDIAGLSLPALACVQVAERRLILHRNVAGDFGFSIRRVQHATASGDLRTVVFAEPNEAKIGPPRPDDVAGLLPGDELVEVQGSRVSQLSRDELQEVVRQAGDTINLVVRTVPELAEFCSRSSDLRQAEAGDSLLLAADVDTSVQEVIPDDVRLWLLHKGGYTQARLLERLPDGRARITVAGREMVVDATDVDKANGSRMDRIGDLAGLKYLNETSAVHVLRHRFGSGLAYTNAGSSSLLYIAGGDALPLNERLATIFKGCRKAQMPAHVYATAQHIYRSMQQSSCSQSVLLQGVSGSGKSQQLQQLAYYLTHAAGWTKALSFARISSALGVLQAMGNAASSLNSDSSRFLMMMQMGFDKAAALKSAKICASLLESERVLCRPEGESNFHVFYYLWEGADERIRSKLKLAEIDNPAPLMKPLRAEEDRAAAREAWSCFLSALSSLGVSAAAIEGICATLGAIFHLARADATPGAAARASFVRAAHATHAAALLGVSQDALSAAVFRGRAAGAAGAALAAAAANINRYSISNRALEGGDALKTFVAALYQELFCSVVEMLNRGLGSTATDAAFTHINIIDPPGCTYSAAWQPARPKQQLQNGAATASSQQSRRPAATLYDLVFNYVNDRLAEAFHDAHFAEMQELYAREQVDVSIPPPIGSPHPLNRLLDQKQQLLNSVDIDRRSEERRGLFAILEEESVFPGATDDSLMERIFVHLGDFSRLIRRGSTPSQFVLAHGLDSHPVAYDVRGWLRVAFPSEIAAAVRPLIGVSKSNAISCLFNPVLPSSSNGGGKLMPGPSESALKLRRLTQSAHLADGGSAAKRAISSSLLAALSAQTDYVFSTVRRGARSHFIHCIQSSTGPSRSSLLSGSSSLAPSSGSSSSGLSPLSNTSSSDSLDVPYVRNQMRGLLLMDAVRASNRGYPERFSFRDFRRRFECLIVSSYQAIGAANQSTELSFTDAVDDRAAVAKILEKMDVHESRFRLGISQVLLQSDVVSMLEERRELSLSGLIVSFQYSCRRHLALRWLEKRRLLETAIRCIQKNGRSYCAVREWPWWKLYTRVVPLLAVTRSDAETREWEERMKALEKQIGELKQTKSRLEGRVCELEEEVTRGVAQSHEMSVALEREGQARIVAERRLMGAEGEASRLSRVSSSATMGAPSASGVVDEAVVETLKKELADAREQEEALRVRTNRTVAQLHESEAELAELRATTATLEKKQARFDADLRVLETAAAEQKKTAERMEKERDEALVVSARRQTEAKEAKDESAELRVQLTRTRRELEEGGGGAGGEDIESLRKTKRELEAKVRDQEDELDDLSGARQMMQQQVSRLEMQCARLQTDIKKEAEARESECEELRASYQRRLRAFEEQVADLAESNQSLTKQNRLMEARCRQNDAAQHSLVYSGGQSRRELRKALALLADTEALLMHERENNQNGAVVRQLREQLEDAEALKVAALKGRHGLESELAELRTQLEMALSSRKVAEERALSLLREKNTGIALLEEKDEQMQALLKKYKASVQQNQIDGIAIADYIEQIADLQSSKQKLVDELHERTSQLEHLHQHTVEKHRMLLMEQKLKEMQAKLDLETAMRTRLESLVAKHSDEAETASEKLADAIVARDKETEIVRKTRKEMVHLTEALEEARKHETELAHRNKNAKSSTEKLEEQVRKLTTDLKLAEKRAEAMRVALAEGIDGGIDEDEEEGESEGEEEYRSETMSTRSGHRSVSSKKRLDEEESVSNGYGSL